MKGERRGMYKKVEIIRRAKMGERERKNEKSRKRRGTKKKKKKRVLEN